MSTPRTSTHRFFAVFLLTALLIAGVASYYASSHPDGLNFVAETAGFSDKEKASPTSDGPFAGYSTKGIGDDRLSGGIAGVAGSLLVLAIAGGLCWVLRRRSGETADDSEETRTASEV
jgi:cobalt/nickel transport protein